MICERKALFVSALSCPAPTPTTGSIFSCNGMTTPFHGTCTLTCQTGYTGGKTLTCNVENGNTATWDLSPACTRKFILNVLTHP